jgi:hypothetical protein
MPLCVGDKLGPHQIPTPMDKVGIEGMVLC